MITDRVNGAMCNDFVRGLSVTKNMAVRVRRLRIKSGEQRMERFQMAMGARSRIGQIPILFSRHLRAQRCMQSVGAEQRCLRRVVRCGCRFNINGNQVDNFHRPPSPSPSLVATVVTMGSSVATGCLSIAVVCNMYIR